MLRRSYAVPSAAEYRSFADVLHKRADRWGARSAYLFLDGDGEVAQELTFAGLDRKAREVAAHLLATAAPGDRALLLFPPGLDFIVGFLGCLVAGVLAVPAYPPRPRGDQPRLRALVTDARPAVVLTTSQLVGRIEGLAGTVPGLAPARLLAIDSLDHRGASLPTADALGPEAPAFLQYTSGSTSEPKGVVVTHGNLLENEELIRRAFGQSEDSVVVGWLPLYHDMGLIGNVLQPLYCGARAVLMSPVSFLQSPRRWLEAVSRYRATTSGGPNFAYELCLARIPAEERAGLDLSSWRVAFNGAEPVRPETMERFSEGFAPVGFRPRALFPCYGLAEATLFVSGTGVAHKALVETFSGVELGQGRGVICADDDAGARRLAASGRVAASAGQEVEVVDPETCRPCSEGRIGEIWVTGPCVASGYWNRPQATEETFGARIADGRGPYLRTGDLGFLHGVGLYVTGRQKDLIIVRGRNHYPQDLERTSEASHSAARPGGAAAFAVEGEDGEAVVLVQEVRRRTERAALPEISDAIRRAVLAEHEVALQEVVLVRRGEVPKTTSGKVRRSACRTRLQAGELQVLARSSLGGRGSGRQRAAGEWADLAALTASTGNARRTALDRYLAVAVGDVLRSDGETLAPDRSLAALGLDSLAAVQLRNAMVSDLGVDVPLAELLAGPTLDELARQVEAARAQGDGSHRNNPTRTQAAPIEHQAVPGTHPVSAGQRALWLTERLEPDRGVYNLAGAARTDGVLDGPALERSLHRLVQRHAALRTTFEIRSGEPVARVHETLPPDVGFAPACSSGELPALAARVAHDPFDLERGPLIRFRAWPLNEGGTGLLLVVHHLVADFWSLDLVLRDLETFYLEEVLGHPARLPEPRISHSELIRREALRLEGPEGERLRAFWRDRVAGGLPVLELPLDRPRSPAAGLAAAARSRRFGRQLHDRAEEYARAQGVTVYAVLLAAYQALLHRVTGSLDVSVVSPAAGRTDPDATELVGYCVKPVVVRSRLDRSAGFYDLVAEVGAEIRAVLEHQDYPLALLVEEAAGGGRRPGVHPLRQTLFVLQRARHPEREGLAAFALAEPGSQIAWADLRLEPLRLPPGASEFDLTLWAASLGGDLAVRLDYRRDLFDGSTAERILGHLETLLGAALSTPERPLADLPLLTPAERGQLLREWQGEPAEPLPAATLHGLVAGSAERTPEAVAFVQGSARLSYGELLRRSGELTERLTDAGVGPGDRVAVLVERGLELPVALLGALGAGAAYVPIDPSYPRRRRELMLNDSEASVVLRTAGSEPSSIGIERVAAAGREGVAAAPGRRPVDAGPESLAYVIYTSGSTGRPKGVAITHGNAAAMVAWALDWFDPGTFDGLLAATSVCFDLSVFELFVPLVAGGTVILADNALELPRLPAAHAVRTVNTVPSAAAELLRSDGLPGSVERILLAGEPLRRSLVDRLYQLPGTVEVLNLYGPSEDTTYSTVARVGRRSGAQPAIGLPVMGTAAHVTDASLRLVPVGVPGELVLGGRGTARGYLGRPGLTAASFVPDPFAERPGRRLYRTGDLVRRRPDGRLDFLGRLDQQVKVRGHRVEPGEIEAALSGHPAVEEAVVALIVGAVGPDGVAAGEAVGERQLAAWVTTAPRASVTGAALRDHLRASVPAAMIPSAFVVLDELPRLPNGKVDRSRLPQPGPDGREVRGARPPEDHLEALLLEIWGEVLTHPPHGVDDDFFSLGGHSLLASRILYRVRERLGIDLPLGTLFEAPTVAGLARRVLSAATDGAPAEEDRASAVAALFGRGRAPENRSGPTPRGAEGWGDRPAPLSFAQERLWMLDRLEPGSAAYHMAGAVDLDGPLDLAALGASLATLARCHEILRTRLPETDEGPVQVVEPPTRPALPVVDLTGLEGPARRSGRLAAAEADRLARAFGRAPFDLALGPLWRAALIRRAATHHRLALTIHHVAGDEASLEILSEELAACYGAALAGRPIPLAPPPVQYRDVAVWLRQRAAAGELDQAADWWSEHLADLVPLELPTDRPRPARRSAAGDLVARPLSGELVQALRSLAAAESTTLFLTFLTAFSALLARVTGSREVPVGTPVSGRDRGRLERVLGFLVDTLVLRVACPAARSFRETMERARDEMLAAREHREAPFELLVERLQPARALDRNPLFDVLVALHRPPAPAEVGPLRLVPREVHTGTSKLDLSLLVVEEPSGGLTLTLEAATELFDRTTAQRLLGALETVLGAVVEDPAIELSAVPLLSAAERHVLTTEWNERGGAADAPAGLPDHFAAVVAANPDRIALLHGPEHLTYRALARRVDARARQLAELGVGPESLVAIVSGRTLTMVEAMLGVLCAGGAYLPVDPDYPPARVEFLLRDGDPHLVFADRNLIGALPEHGCPVIALDDRPAGGAGRAVGSFAATQTDQLAYTIYTSGSTGTPKGVAIRHGGLAALIRWAAERYEAADLRGVLAATSVCFDLSAFELFVPLALGGTVILAKDALALAELPEAERVTLVNTVPSAMSALLDGEHLPRSVGTVNLAGEALRRDLVDALYARPEVVAVYNLYGPSEDTTYSTEARVPAAAAAEPSIGRPLPRKVAHLLDAQSRLVPIGAVGELWLAGEGLARGYIGRPAATAERFRPDPFATRPGDRIYRTGDLGRHLADGRIQFLGRADRQVKVRGFRIELGEIEAALERHPAVSEAVVEAPEDGAGERRLVAYVVVEEGTGGAGAEVLEAHLAKRLPAHLVPGEWLHLPRLPRTPNGKVDRKALPAPGGARLTDRGGDRTPPRTAMERALWEIWSELLPAALHGVDEDFFRIGGHSLLATRLVSRVRKVLGVELGITAVFEERTIARLARRIEAERAGAPAASAAPIQGSTAGGVAPLALSQERLWFLDQMEPGNPVYNLPVALRIHGPLDARALGRSVQRIVDRHGALRASFRIEGGRPVQVVRPRAPVPLPRIDLQSLPTGIREHTLRAVRRREALVPFDLARDSLVRLRLVRLAPRDHLLAVTLHHIVADGWSLGVFMEELGAHYGAAVTGAVPKLPDLPVQYGDFARWQRRWLDGVDLGPEIDYWRGALEGAPAILELPADRPRPPVQSHRGGSRRVAVPAEVAGRLEAIGRAHGATLFMTLLGAFGALLWRLTGRADLVLGTPTAGRDRVEVEHLIGLFTDSLVLRLDLAGAPPFLGLLERVRDTLVASYAHQRVPFEMLVEQLRPRRDLSHNPIYQVVFALEDMLRPEPELAGLDVAAVPAESWTAKFDLALYMERTAGRLTGLLEYNRDLFDASSGARMLSQFGTLLSGIATDPDCPISALPLLSPPERHQLLVEANDTARPEPAEPFIHRWFEAQAALRPDAPAVTGAGHTVSYRELDRRANALAHRLVHRGVAPDVPVAVAMDRRPELLVALLGILKAGGAYLPLDLDYPAERLAFMLEDSGCPVVLTAGDALGNLPLEATKVVRCDGPAGSLGAEAPAEAATPPAVAQHPEHLAYVIYTSGSTGKPKGTMISHRSLASYTATARASYGICAEDRVLQFCSISFDISLEEIVPCLASGGELVLRDDAMVSSADRFLTACRARRLTVLSLPTAFWHGLTTRLDSDGACLPPALRLVIIAGERAVPEHLAVWLRHAPERPRLINTYGLTESTIISTVGDLTTHGAPASGREVPIGRTVADSELYVLDRYLEPVPAGVPGELFIGGGLLARGYLARPKTTGERFVPHTISETPGCRLYRTGDLARFLPDGTLEFLGRQDHQVKVRGYRIELGEIETALSAHPAVSGAVVVAQEESGDKRLVGYLVTDGQEAPAVAALRAFLGQTLPDYMIPNRYVLLDNLPLTPNGKVDRAALPALDGRRPEVGSEYVAPQNRMERTIAEIWARALRVDRVGVDDNFFDLGGHSLLLVEVHQQIKERLGRDVPIVDLFAHPTVGALARQLRAGDREEGDLDAIRRRAARRRATAGADRFRAARGRLDD